MFGASTFAVGQAPSQDGGYASLGPNTPEDARRPRRQEDKANCVPVTVRMIQGALSDGSGSGDGGLRIHGAEVATVLVVGVVEGLSRGNMSLEFVLNDGSGRIKVRYYYQDKNADGIEEGRYVSLAGQAHTSPAQHVGAMCVRPVDSADQVAYHLIEVAHASLKLRAGTGQGAAMMGSAAALTTPVKPNVTAQDEPRPTPEKPSAPATQLVGKDLEEALSALLNEPSFCDPAGGGKTAMDLAAALKPPSDAQVVQDALKKMEQDGLLFIGESDSHYLPLGGA